MHILATLATLDAASPLAKKGRSTPRLVQMDRAAGSRNSLSSRSKGPGREEGVPGRERNATRFPTVVPMRDPTVSEGWPSNSLRLGRATVLSILAFLFSPVCFVGGAVMKSRLAIKNRAARTEGAFSSICHFVRMGTSSMHSLVAE